MVLINYMNLRTIKLVNHGFTGPEIQRWLSEKSTIYDNSWSFPVIKESFDDKVFQIGVCPEEFQTTFLFWHHLNNIKFSKTKGMFS